MRMARSKTLFEENKQCPIFNKITVSLHLRKSSNADQSEQRPERCRMHDPGKKDDKGCIHQHEMKKCLLIGHLQISLQPSTHCIFYPPWCRWDWQLCRGANSIFRCPSCQQWSHRSEAAICKWTWSWNHHSVSACPGQELIRTHSYSGIHTCKPKHAAGTAGSLPSSMDWRCCRPKTLKLPGLTFTSEHDNQLSRVTIHDIQVPFAAVITSRQDEEIEHYPSNYCPDIFLQFGPINSLYTSSLCRKAVKWDKPNQMHFTNPYLKLAQTVYWESQPTKAS